MAKIAGVMKAPEVKSGAGGRGAMQARSARHFPWTKEEDALLGKVTDRALAQKLNRTVGAVRDRRRHLGKTGLGQSPQVIPMHREPRDHYAHLFANKTNREIQVILGWSY